MKYIRTKDGRILDLDRIKLYAESYSFNDESETHLSVEWDIIREEIDIIAKADTIEELCDDVVVKYQNQLPIPERIKNLKECMKLNHITWEEHFSWLFKRFKEKLEWVKLAIWTDKGLIYVAKMNDKGELELL